LIADEGLEQSRRWRAACRYRLERLLLREKSIIDRSASVAARVRAGEHLGDWREDLVMVSIQFVKTLQHKVRCPIRSRP